MSGKIKIVHYWGGCPTIATSKWLSFLMLIKKCTENGWENWLVFSKKPNNPDLIEPLIKAGCKVAYQPRSQSNFDLKSVYRNFRLLRKIKCNIFHCYNDHTSPLIAATLVGIPVKIWSKLSMSSYYELGSQPCGLQKLMISTRLTCFLSNRIFAISDLAGKEIVEQVGFKNKIITVNVPVSVERFEFSKVTPVRSELKISETDVVVASVGRAIKVKGWDIAVKAFIHVSNSIPNAKLLLIGEHVNSDYYKDLCTLVNQNNLKDKVIFVGARSDIPEILKISNIFILPSRSEGTPAALIEAMATGLPCIATKTGGIPEVIQDGENGLLFERENEQQLADKIISLITDDSLKVRLLNNVKNDLQRFSIETYVNDVFTHYTSLLK